ncbi:MAG: phytanoyl-CoA dioxygenase family protein [Caldimonas sp.]
MVHGTATLVPGAIDATLAATWLQALDRHYDACVARADADFDAYSSSLRLRSVPGIEVETMLAQVFRGAVAAILRDDFGPRVACDVDQCWARRQYPLDRYPPRHAAHRWHQDGALAFDFLAHAGTAPAAADLLHMATCWIALTPCGGDAPGLELVCDAGTALLPLDALDDSAVRVGHGSAAFERPVLEPGDALVFGGGVLHHTHVTPTMTRARTSVELRFFAADRIPDRLRGDRFTNVH